MDGLPSRPCLRNQFSGEKTAPAKKGLIAEAEKQSAHLGVARQEKKAGKIIPGAFSFSAFRPRS